MEATPVGQEEFHKRKIKIINILSKYILNKFSLCGYPSSFKYLGTMYEFLI